VILAELLPWTEKLMFLPGYATGTCFNIE